MKLLLITVLACLVAIAQSEKIVNGVDTTVEMFPHQISLRSYGSHICGGSLIHSRWVLTAAHCLSGTPTKYSIQYGTTRRSQNSNQVANVLNFIRHASYNSNNYQNDIALIELDRDLDLSGSSHKAILLNKNFDKNYLINTVKVCDVTGWGTTRAGSSTLPDVLQVVNLPIVDINRSNYTASQIADSMMIAGDATDGIIKDSCQGDSGGPLSVTVGGKQYLTGLTSWGYSCGWSGVYTRVSSYISWIESNTRLTFP
jgi:secreted trypsin-like serine protease